MRAELDEDVLSIELRRRDGFAGRCAGSVVAKLPAAGRSRARFSFGKLPPAQGGPPAREVDVALSEEGPADARVRVTVRPYLGFPRTARLALSSRSRPSS